MTETHTVGITGAAGYIGSRVTKNLLEDGHDVVPIDDFSVGDVREVRGVEIREQDVRDEDALQETFADVDAMLHLAAVSGVPDCEDNPDWAFDANVRGTENVAWFCRKRGIPMVHPTSMAIIGDPVDFPITADHPRNPLNLYGITKKMNEDDVHELARGEFPAHVFMKSNLYGHHDLGERTIGKNTVINIFVDRALEEKPLTVHKPGTQSRDFVHVKDIARAYERSLDVLIGGEAGAATIPIASGEEHSVLDIANLVQRVVEEERGYTVDVELVENPRGAETAAEDFTVDTSTARETIGFEAEHTVEETVREIVSK